MDILKLLTIYVQRKEVVMINRVQELTKRMYALSMDGILISSEYNRHYLSGFTGSSGYLFITDQARYLLTDFRYIEQATAESPDFKVVNYFEKGLVETISDLVSDTRITNLGYEDTTITVKEFNHLSSSIDQCNWSAVGNMVEQIRMIKDHDEIQKIRHAASIGDAAFLHILDRIKPGMREIDVAVELEYFMKKQGASKLSFDTIIASGKRSSLPHAQPTEKLIEKGDFVTMDFGCIYEGYCSDMTRTIVVGQANERQKDLYSLVLKAQMKALNNIKAGILGKDGDALARQIIDDAGYRVNFGHGLGHSLGLEVHEQPRFSLLSEEIILPGMVMSVEPGVYIPDFGGVRIEDLVLIKEDGIENFVSSRKELIEL